MSDYLCIYHNRCNDGSFSAAVVKKYLQEKDPDVNISFYAADYHQLPPYDICSDRIVYVVDFSYPREMLEKIKELAKELHIIDHHKTAADQLKDFEADTVIFGDGYCGAYLCWMYFYPDTPIPKVVKYVDDRDLWKKQYQETDIIYYGLVRQRNNFDKLINYIDNETSLAMIIADGAIIQNQYAYDIDIMLEDNIRELIIGGEVVKAANIPYHLASDACNKLALMDPSRFAVTYCDQSGYRTFSLRSASEGMKVNDIAKVYGGGGHDHAAGFKVPLTDIWQFELPIPK